MREPEQTSSDVANGSASRTRRSGRAGLLAGAAALAVALTLPAAALAQASFGDPANFAVGDAPLAVATGDFNGDSIHISSPEVSPMHRSHLTRSRSPRSHLIFDRATARRRRHRSTHVGRVPEDGALYRCRCGTAFTAAVTACVTCPTCGEGQAW